MVTLCTSASKCSRLLRVHFFIDIDERQDRGQEDGTKEDAEEAVRLQTAQNAEEEKERWQLRTSADDQRFDDVVYPANNQRAVGDEDNAFRP